VGFKPSTLSYVLYKLPITAKYKTFDIPKRHGGVRTIKAPVDALKRAQENLSVLLQDCLDEINAAKKRKDRIAHGFKRERSIITNAREHRNRRWVFNIDLEDFFPSINFGRVRGFFIHDQNFALHKDVATVVAQIACDGIALPQGSPCSPVISNLIGHLLDMRLVKLASVAKCTYSRYADDLTFSTNEADFPSQVARVSSSNSHLWVPSAKLQNLIIRSGFKVNSTKTRMQYRTSRQDVTGLVVNRRISVRHEYRHAVRAMVHRLLNTGSFELAAAANGTPNQLHGMLGFIDSIDLASEKHRQKSREAGSAKNSESRSSREVIYRRFLIYTNFFAAESPVVLCEGETDTVYLTHAIRGLAAAYPSLAAIDSRGKITLNVRLFKFRKSSTDRILGFHDGGSSGLAKFISIYKKETARFHAPGEKFPLIIVFDHDSGAKGIKSVAGQASSKPLDWTQPFVHIVRNLYAVPTPLIGTVKESKIEDFFDESIKSTVLNGKTFDPNNDIDSSTHYGKKAFAHSVVKPNANSIDFRAFGPLLTNLVSAINSHPKP
jgi:retron-type reverse transcriptase